MDKKDLTIKEAQKIVEDFLRERKWFPKDSDTRYYAFCHMVEEIGEAARCIIKLEHAERKRVTNSDDDNTLKELEMELADIFYHVFKIASAYNIDVDEAFKKVMEKNRKKFPMEKFKEKKD